ncbi:MAG: hypothetical protein EOP50_00965 [Sphingobacteriales bacterium]|nr:MAG: hypothetical protein EOP50_00965 [Sphingobacteriales bacterium]
MPLTPPGNNAAYASLARASASTTVQTSQGQTSIHTTGQHRGDGTYSAIANLDQGSWGLSFGPAGQGLLLPAYTTLTVSADVQGSVRIDGNCPVSTGLATEWCDSASAYAYIELNYIDPANQIFTNVGDLFHALLLTQAIGQEAQKTEDRRMSVSLTNSTDRAVPISFRYNIQLDGRSVATAVPEPFTWALACVGLLIVAGVARSRRDGR